MESNGWFGSLKNSMSNAYRKAKDAVSPKPDYTPQFPMSTGGSKKRSRRSRKKKGTRRVRFSKKHKVYRYKTMRKY